MPDEANAHSELIATWKQSLKPGIDFDILSPAAQAGKILDHCVRKVMRFRGSLGGLALCVYKIGITSDLNRRWPSYQEQNFRRMLCLHASNNLSVVEHLEASLILHFSSHTEGALRNVNKGGEGMRLKGGAPRFPPPYFLYCVGADASQGAMILG